MVTVGETKVIRAEVKFTCFDPHGQGSGSQENYVIGGWGWDRVKEGEQLATETFFPVGDVRLLFLCTCGRGARV